MAYDEHLVRRLRGLLKRKAGCVEKKMFGGVGFLLHGNMCVGVWKEFLIVRVGPGAYEAALAERHAREFDITGRSMRGWVMVAPDGVADEQALHDWVHMAVRFAAGLPRKS